MEKEKTKDITFLQGRLKAVLAMLRGEERLLDVGSDHAYLPIAFCMENERRAAFACDNKEGPLMRAKRNIERYGMGSRVKTRLYDGIDDSLAEKCDVITIAGLGGESISSILEKSKAAEGKRLILQPMSAADELRQFLNESEYRISSERLIKEKDKLYIIMDVKKGESEGYSFAQYHLGKRILEGHSEIHREYFAGKRNKLEKIIKRLSNEETERQKKIRAECMELLAAIKIWEGKNLDG